MLVSKKINDLTKYADITVEGGDREYYDDSEWTITLNQKIFMDGAGYIGQVIPKGATFRYTDEYGATAEDVEYRLRNYGILRHCGVSDGYLEYHYLEDDPDLEEEA